MHVYLHSMLVNSRLLAIDQAALLHTQARVSLMQET